MTASVPDFREVYEVLGGLRRGFPAKLLRQLKEQVYELVPEDNPQGRLHVVELDKDDDLSGVEVVFGVGAIEALRSYVGLDRDDLIEDVVNGGNLNAGRVVQEALPKILTGPANVPIFKYLREAGMLDAEGELLETDVPKKVANRVRARPKKLGVIDQFKAAADKAVAEHKTLKELSENLEPFWVFQYIPALSEDEVDPEELRRYLIKHEDMYESRSYRSQWAKIVCLYDWLQYGRQNKSKGRRGPRPRLKAGPKDG